MGSDFSTTYERKALRTHKCSECPRPILPGQTYVKAVWKNDGGFASMKNCLRCHRVYGKIWRWFDFNDEWAPSIGTLWAWIREARDGRFDRMRDVKKFRAEQQAMAEKIAAAKAERMKANA